LDKGDGYEHPQALKVPELPLVRDYLLPDVGEVFVHRDYNQQEFRILAHYEDGALRQSYLSNPRIDYHNLMQARIKDICGTEYSRRLVKAINFAICYGTGIPKLAEMAHVEISVAKELREAAKLAAPGVAELQAELKYRGKTGKPLRTWGGREYFCEPAAYSKKYDRLVSFEYRLLNTLIQGSAADCTKEAIIRWHALRKTGRMLVTVHDEINLSVPKQSAKAESERLREAMESVEFDIPMLTDAKYGPSWGQLEKEKA
jgi:DNA polymerase I-like protein with 3'-5' exonuclease and polymerase domains